MKDIAVITNNQDLREKLNDVLLIHNIRLHVFDDIIEAAKSWNSISPIITVLDIDLPRVNAVLFIKSIPDHPSLIHAPNQFFFLSETSSESVTNAQEAIGYVRFGFLAIKNIEQHTAESFSEIGELILHNYENLISEKKLISPNKDSEVDNHNDQEKGGAVLTKIDRTPIEVIVIGTSTGGPSTLRKMISRITTLNYPLVIIQHIIPHFIEGYIETLSSLTHIHLELAKQGQVLQKGHIYFAPDLCHLRISKIDENLFILLDHSEPIKGYRPSIDTTFSSIIAEKIHCLGVIMTGIGSDGVLSLKKLHSRGCPTIAQLPADCIAPSMPNHLIKSEAADDVLSADDIADLISEI